LTAFSIRFSARRESSSRSPDTTERLRPARQRDLDAPLACERGERLDHDTHDGPEVDRGLGLHMRTQLDARQRQKIVDESRHALRLRLHDREESARARVVAGRALAGSRMKPRARASGAQLVLTLAMKSTRMVSSRAPVQVAEDSTTPASRAVRPPDRPAFSAPIWHLEGAHERMRWS
jgi:hypothetical protein